MNKVDLCLRKHYYVSTIPLNLPFLSNDSSLRNSPNKRAIGKNNTSVYQVGLHKNSLQRTGLNWVSPATSHIITIATLVSLATNWLMYPSLVVQSCLPTSYFLQGLLPIPSLTSKWHYTIHNNFLKLKCLSRFTNSGTGHGLDYCHSYY